MSNGDTDSPIDPEKQFRATLTRSIFTVPTTRLLQQPGRRHSEDRARQGRAELFFRINRGIGIAIAHGEFSTVRERASGASAAPLAPMGAVVVISWRPDRSSTIREIARLK